MIGIVFALACLASASYGNRLHIASDSGPSYYSLAELKQLLSNGRTKGTGPLQALTSLLLESSHPAAAWHVAGLGPHTATNYQVNLEAGRPSHLAEVSMQLKDLLDDRAKGPQHAVPPAMTRRNAASSIASVLSLVLGATVLPLQANAQIKGSAPPAGGMKPKKRSGCKNIEECEELGQKKEQEMLANERTDFERTKGGDRYRDLVEGTGSKSVAEGDAIDVRYRVMRLGTKARDGLTGEGQTIFSLGYGEDEDKEGDTLPVQLAGNNLIPAVNDALVGMKPGGRRRVLVRPERGWKDQSASCANKVFTADIGAQIENENACQNKVSLPQPRTYGAKARFGRRFDESLLVELDVVAFTDAKKVVPVGTPSSSQATPFVYDKCKNNPFADGCDDSESKK